MTMLKKASVLALIMVALIIPVVALSDNAAGEVGIDKDIRVVGGFDDRSSGSIVVTLYNDGSTEATVTLFVIGLYADDGRVFAGPLTWKIPAGGIKEDTIKFPCGSTGTHWAKVVVEGDNIDAVRGEMSFEFTVGRSIWSNTWTYVAIIVVIIIVAIAALIKMRSNPRIPENVGTFTAMEEERKAGKQRSKTEREEYKARKKE